MDIIEIKTLIDITNTGVLRLTQGTALELDQNRNFSTLRQCCEMRSVIFYQSPSSIEEIDVKNLGFGSSYKGTNNVWTFRFSPDRSDVYIDNDGNSIGQLIEDIHEVPVIRNLKETINIHKAIFDCKDSKFKNTIIKALQGTI
jgi:hypothetical protein